MTTLKLEDLLAAYKAIKAHDNEIMPLRPAGWPSGDWRMKNPHNQRTAYRVTRDGKSVSVSLNYDTVPILMVINNSGRIIENIDLRADDAAEKVSAFTLPASNNMTSHEFAAIRKRLGLTQAQLAPLLDFAGPLNVSSFERATNPRSIPTHIARIMNAMDAGWRPSDWPVEKAIDTQ